MADQNIVAEIKDPAQEQIGKLAQANTIAGGEGVLAGASATAAGEGQDTEAGAGWAGFSFSGFFASFTRERSSLFSWSGHTKAREVTWKDELRR